MGYAILDGKIGWIIRAAESRLIVGVDGKPGRSQLLDIELPIDLSRSAGRGGLTPRRSCAAS